MTVAANIDPRKYGRLLARTLPVVIETEADNERMLAEADRLMDKDKLSPEESKLFDLMVRLIEDFEERHYQINASTPHGILRELMAARGVTSKDLWGLFGSKGTASEVINGKRSISKAHAKALGEFFRVSAELFI
ncbi:MAG TPA: transcriptional regulator [Blastocatellia bacterium]|nr:transcriptional regulator [Blastocatellia bacterium]